MPSDLFTPDRSDSDTPHRRSTFRDAELSSAALVKSGNAGRRLALQKLEGSAADNLGPKAWMRYPHLSPARLRQDKGDGPITAFAQAGEELPQWAVLGARFRDLLGGAGRDRAGWEEDESVLQCVLDHDA
jgi:hypothetical protein